MRRLVLDPIFRQDVNDMEAFARKLEGSDVVPALAEYARYYDKLKLHLFLTAPRAVAEPRIGPAQQAWIGSQIADRWSARGSSGGDPVPAELIGADAELFAKLLADDAGLALPRYEDVVRRVRRVMQRVPLSSLALARLVGEVDGKGYDLNLATLLGGPVPVLRSTAKVPGAFTRRGYEEVVKTRFDNPAAILEPWVVEISGREGGEAEEMERLRSRYFLEYVDVWKRFLASISVQGTVGNAQALAMLQDLTSGEPPPLRRLFRGVGYNTRLGGVAGILAKTAEGALDKLREKLGTTPARGAAFRQDDREAPRAGPLEVERAFAGFVDFGVPPDAPAPAAAGGPAAPRTAGIDVYQEQISFVRDALQTAMESSDPGPLLSKVQSARTRVRSLIDAQEIGWRPRLEALLWPPLEGASLSSVREAAAGASVKWCATVALPFQRNIASRYPFRLDGDPAALADVAEFFRPSSGILWGFYNEALRADVQRAGDGFQFARSLGGVSGFRPELLSFLKRAQEISTVLFPSGSADPSVQLSLRVRPTPRVAVAWFEVDGQKFDYRNGPEEWHRIVWPGQGKSSGASLRVRTASGQEETIQQDGEWGLLRLVESGKLAGEPGARDFAVSWSLPSLGTSVTVDFRPARSETPFFGVRHPGEKARLFSPFRSGIAAPLNIGKSGPAWSEAMTVPMPAAARPAVGLFGKIRAQGDFVRINASDPAVPPFVRWLEEGNELLHRAGTMLGPEPIGFLFAGSDRVLVGAIGAGMDSVGRPYPLALFTALAGGELRGTFPLVPALHRGFLQGASALLGKAPDLPVREIAERLAALDLPGAPDRAAAESIACEARGERARELEQRVFGDVASGQQYYAFRTFQVGCQPLRGRDPGRVNVALDCPCERDGDLSIWLELARRLLQWPVPPSFFFRSGARPALVLSLGSPPPAVLPFFAAAPRGNQRIWPLTTQQAAAVSAARKSLPTSQLLVIDGPHVTVEELLTSLSVS